MIAWAPRMSLLCLYVTWRLPEIAYYLPLMGCRSMRSCYVCCSQRVTSCVLFCFPFLLYREKLLVEARWIMVFRSKYGFRKVWKRRDWGGTGDDIPQVNCWICTKRPRSKQNSPSPGVADFWGLLVSVVDILLKFKN